MGTACEDCRWRHENLAWIPQETRHVLAALSPQTGVARGLVPRSGGNVSAKRRWIPASAGMTEDASLALPSHIRSFARAPYATASCNHLIPAFAGMTNLGPQEMRRASPGFSQNLAAGRRGTIYRAPADFQIYCQAAWASRSRSRAAFSWAKISLICACMREKRSSIHASSRGKPASSSGRMASSSLPRRTIVSA